MPQDDNLALNEAVANIRRLIEIQRQMEAMQSPNGEQLLMEPSYGIGLPPMIASVTQPDR